MEPIKSNEPINLFYTNQDLNFFYTHPNLWVTGEFPLVADDDLRRPGSYNGFTCLDSIAISLFGKKSLYVQCVQRHQHPSLFLTSIPENLVPGDWLLSLSSLPSALWESGMLPRIPVSTATLFARSCRPRRSGFAEPLLDKPFSGVARPAFKSCEMCLWPTFLIYTILNST